MIVFINSIKRLFKNKIQIFVLILLPFITIIPIQLSSSGEMGTFNVGIVNKDPSNFTSMFTKRLKLNCKVYTINENDIKSNLKNSKIDYVIVIPKGYTDGIINSRDVKLEGYEKKGKKCSDIIEGISNSFLIPAKKIAKLSSGNSTAFNMGIAKIPEVKINNSIKKDNAIIWGLVIQFIMFSAVLTSTLILSDKENKTFYRSLNSPIALKNYMFQTILSFVVVSFIQVLVLSVVSVFGLGVYAGSSILNILVILAVMSLVSVSFGVAISSISKNTTQTTLAGVGITTLMCLMGGAWGMNPSSKTIKAISKILPVTWAMEGIEKLLNNNSLASVSQDIAVLLLFAVVFFLLGTWRKTDIVK